MITFMESKEKMEEAERCLDPQLWHACAGGMVQMPAVNSLVYYFPQGHAEHACGPVDFGRLPVTPYTLCRVSAVKFMADPDTDEVFAKLRLSPLPPDHDAGDGAAVSGESQAEKPASFAKTLTQSDANNGGGFSVPRYCAETIFPRLDYGADPPVQTVLAKDVHGETWKFRHIYRGTPRRHLLTTGWSTFVNHKKLAAGDSIVFLRTDGGELYVGIRRAKRGAAEGSSGWNCAAVAPYEGKASAKVRPEAVAAAAAAAAGGGREFEVVYYPRGSTPEFCVSASLVKAALQIRWCSGLRFKMAFETEDSSRISWFMGTVSSVQVADPLRWPHSPWRLLQVTWDEPDLLQNVKRVSPWLVELVSTMPAIHLSSFSPPRKKLRLPHQHPLFLGTYNNNNNNLYGINNATPAGMQGARHNTQCALSLLSDFRLTNPLPPTSIASENVSCLLTMSNPAPQTPPPRLPLPPPPPRLVLFGKPILTEQQISLTCSANGASSDRERPELGLESGHCKVFVESEGFGRTLDLSLLGSYDDLYSKLAEMFSVENSKARGQVLYRDGDGAVKHIGDEPFSDFTKTTRRLTILMNSGQYNNIGISENAEKKT